MNALWFSSVAGPVPVTLEKVIPDSPGSGLFLCHIKVDTDAHPGYPKGVRLTLGADAISVAGTVIHNWARQYKRIYGASRMDELFIEWLENKLWQPSDSQ